MHNLYIKADKVFSEEVKDYDLMVLPRGRPSGATLKENPEVIGMVQYYNKHKKYLAVMCLGFWCYLMRKS